MSTRRDPKGDVRHTHNRVPHGGDEDGQPTQSTLIQETSEHMHLAGIGLGFSRFVGLEGGYLKVRRSLDERDVHLTYSWSAGTHQGCYVYVRIEYFRIGYGLDLLWGKVLSVQEGRIRPTPDKRVNRF